MEAAKSIIPFISSFSFPNIVIFFALFNFIPVDKDSSLYISNWFKGKRYQHLTFISRDYISFHVLGLQNGITKNPFMLDYSMSTEGINCNLKSKEGLEKLSRVQTVIDSFYPDIIKGNDAANFISSKGNDFIQGNGGNDVY